jgi:hypothetical protein
MALSHYVSYTTTGTKASVNMDPSIAPFSATIGVGVGGGATYNVQYSLDPVETPDASSVWFNDPIMPSGTTTSLTSPYTFPVTKVRIVIVLITDTVQFKTLQGFTTN